MGYNGYRLKLKTPYKGAHGAGRCIYNLTAAAFYFFLVNL
nr:MAG TPA: hypothetical protein [Caudoviricetes sp.]